MTMNKGVIYKIIHNDVEYEKTFDYLPEIT